MNEAAASGTNTVDLLVTISAPTLDAALAARTAFELKEVRVCARASKIIHIKDEKEA